MNYLNKTIYFVILSIALSACTSAPGYLAKNDLVTIKADTVRELVILDGVKEHLVRINIIAEFFKDSLDGFCEIKYFDEPDSLFREIVTSDSSFYVSFFPDDIGEFNCDGIYIYEYNNKIDTLEFKLNY